MKNVELEQVLECTFENCPYEGCDVELLIMYDDSENLVKADVDKVIEVCKKMGHPVIEFNSICYYSTKECSNEEFENTLREMYEEENDEEYQGEVKYY